MPDPETTELINRLEQGSQEALAELYSRYRPKLKRMVSFRLDPRLRGRIDASDVLQEVYLDALQRVNHFLKDPTRSFFIWLRLLAGQRLIDLRRVHLRAQMRDANREVGLDLTGSPHASSACLAEHLSGGLTSPSHAAMKAEARSSLEEALDQMEPVDREVIALRHFEELGNNEAAQILGLNKTAASNRYVRAMKRLKEILVRTPGLSAGGNSSGGQS